MSHRHGDCRHGGGSDGARADCSRASGGAPACGQPGCRDRPEAEPRPCGSPRPPRAMPPGRLRSPPAAPGPRSRASVPDALRRLLGVLAGGHGVERGAGHAPGGADPPQAVGQTRAGRGGGGRDLRRPKGPKVSVLASSSSTCMVNSPIRFMALSSSACTGSPLRCLSEASIPPIAFSRHCSSRKISTPNWRDRSCTGSSRKSRGDLTLAATVHRGQVPAGRPAKPGLGKTWTSKLARIYHRPIHSNFLLKIIGHVPVLLGHFD